MIRVPVHRRLAAPAAIIFAAAVTAVSAQGVAACTPAALPWSINAVTLGGQNARIFIAQTDIHHINRLARSASARSVPARVETDVVLAAQAVLRFGYAAAIGHSSHPHAAP